MKLELIFGLIKAIAEVVKGWFGWMAGKEKQKKDAIDKTASGIGNGKPFIAIMLLLFVAGCGYVYTVSTPLTFDPNDFQELEAGEEFKAPNAGYYFSNEALESYIRAKIAEYEIRKRGFFHKETEK